MQAVQGSLCLRRNFTFNMQAFSFSRSFLDRLRAKGPVFRSPFPDYYLANVAMGMGGKIVVSPEPLAVAGVSRASFGFTLFNNLEEKGAAMLNSKLAEDEMFTACEPFLLPGPAYHTNYIITMEHVARMLGAKAPCGPSFERYRRLQVFSFITSQNRYRWNRSPEGARLWERLSQRERVWALRVGFLNWRAKAGSVSHVNALDQLKKEVEPYGFIHIETDRAVGLFAVLSELFGAIEAGNYPRSRLQ
jgi:hypothetical protein